MICSTTGFDAARDVESSTPPLIPVSPLPPIPYTLDKGCTASAVDPIRVDSMCEEPQRVSGRPGQDLSIAKMSPSGIPETTDQMTDQRENSSRSR